MGTDKVREEVIGTSSERGPEPRMRRDRRDQIGDVYLQLRMYMCIRKQGRKVRDVLHKGRQSLSELRSWAHLWWYQGTILQVLRRELKV